jgi:hypothetical protein
VIDEIDVQEILDFRFREAAFYGEETTVERLTAAARDGCAEACPIGGPERADFDPASTAQRLECRIVGCVHHERQPFS